MPIGIHGSLTHNKVLPMPLGVAARTPTQGPTTFPVLRRQKGSLWPNQHTFPVLGRLPWMHPAASSDHQRVLRTLRDAQTSSTEASAAERFTDAMPF